MAHDFRGLVDNIWTHFEDTFGEEVLFTPKNGNGVFKIKGVFDNAYQSVDADTQEIISSNQATIGVNLNDIKGNKVSKGDKFKVRNIKYRVIDTQEDGQGGCLVLLQKIRADEKVSLRKNKRDFRD